MLNAVNQRVTNSAGITTTGTYCAFSTGVSPISATSAYGNMIDAASMFFTFSAGISAGAVAWGVLRSDGTYQAVTAPVLLASLPATAGSQQIAWTGGPVQGLALLVTTNLVGGSITWAQLTATVR